MMVKLSVIVVTWNSGQVIEKTLQSLFRTKADFEFEVFVVDNNSEDETVEIVKKNFPQVHLIENEANYGFAKAANQIIRQVETDLVLVINPGLIVSQEAMIQACEFVEKRDQAAVVSCALRTEQGRAVNNFGKFPGFFNLLLNQEKTARVLREEEKVDYVSKDFFLISKKNIREYKFFGDRTLPEFDDRYEGGCEDIDYCLQVKKAGGEVWFLPQVYFQIIQKDLSPGLKKQKARYRKKSTAEYSRKWHGLIPAWLVEIFG